MDRQNSFGFSLANVSRRQSLKPRNRPYFQVIQYGRAIGYEKQSSGKSYWVARMRLRNESYRQKRVGLSEDNEPRKGISFDEACEAAQVWFSTSRFGRQASDTRPIGDIENLRACPIGSVYTVGHALCELVEWKRLVGAHSHFLTVVNLTNYHFVPRLFSLPAVDMNSERLRHFVKDVLETPPKIGNQPVKAKRPISQMTEDELRRRKKTINTLIGILKMALVMAWESGHLESDRPWRCLRRLHNVDRPRVLHLSRPECFRLLDRCGPELRNLVMAALYTGCRITELVRMQASHIGRDGPGVYVTPVKSYRPRVVLLPDEGLEFFDGLAAGKKPDEFLFLRNDGRAWLSNYRYWFRNAVAEADLPKGFCFHGLRHTYASQLIQVGTPLIVVAEQLGHRNIDTVSRTYGHLAPDIRLAEVRKRFASLRITSDS